MMCKTIEILTTSSKHEHDWSKPYELFQNLVVCIINYFSKLD